MIHYITSFIVYTLAMIGILVIAYVVYKKTVLLNPINKNSSLKIVDMLKLPDRKILYVIKCKNEEFLIGSSNDKLNLISKLNKTDKETLNKAQTFEEENKISLLKELSDKKQTRGGL